MVLFYVIVVAALVYFIYYVLSGNLGARSVVRIVFDEFVKFNNKIQLSNDNKFVVNDNLVFNTERQARSFILNAIFVKRFSRSERESDRYKLEIEVHGKTERFEFVRNGEKNWAELYKFQNLGDLICTIWYIESGLRGIYYYGSFGGAFDSLPYLDEYSSKLITEEYEKQIKLHQIDDLLNLDELSLE